MCQFFDAWEVKVVINIEQSLKNILTFVAKWGAVASFWVYSFFYLAYHSRSKLAFGQPNSWLKKQFFLFPNDTPDSIIHFKLSSSRHI